MSRLYTISILFTPIISSLPPAIVQNTIANIRDTAQFYVNQEKLYAIRKCSANNVLKIDICTHELIDEALIKTQNLLGMFIPEFLDPKFMISEQFFPLHSQKKTCPEMQ